MPRFAGSLEYAQARLSAHLGERPDEAAWRRIEHLRELPALLDAARPSAFGAWLGGIDSATAPHAIERLMRERFRALVAEVAAWMPAEWQPAVAWCALVVDLAAIEHLAHGGAVASWMRDDPMLAPLIGKEANESVEAPHDGPFAPLAAAWSEPTRVARLWRVEWHRRLPSGALGKGTLLDELARKLHAHLAAFHDSAVRDGWPLRRALQAELVLLFRRAMLDPAAAFIFVALGALDLERLRGELVRRAAFRGLALAA
jgi:hypothetical protein